MAKVMPRYLLIALLLLVFSCGCAEEVVREVAIGRPAPDFAVKDINGNIVILSNFKGQPVILRFFETDCRYCRADTPIFNVYFEKYKEKGLQVFYISAYHESEKTVTTFIKDLDVPFPIIMDTDARIADLYRILLYPQTIFIAPDQTVLAIIPGGVGEAELDEMVGPHLHHNIQPPPQT